MPKHFIKKKEDFVCENCGTKVIGAGYTNHCHNCLWSKHVDKLVPGDRLSACQGLMEPVGLEIRRGKYLLIHRCQKCQKISKNKTGSTDNFENIIALSKAKIKLAS